MQKQSAVLGVAAAALTLGGVELRAQTNTWLNPTAGKWETGTNWSLGGPPSGGQSVFLRNTNLAGTVAIIDAATATNSSFSLTVSNLTIFGNSLLVLTNAGTSVPLHILKNLNLAGGGRFTEKGSALRVDGLMSLVDGSLAVTDGSTLNVANGTLGIGNDGTTTNGTGTGIAGITNATLSTVTLNVGSTAGGVGSLTLGSNGLLNVASNFTVVSGSLVATSSVSLSGGSFSATNGLTQIGPAGNGVLTVSDGNHTFRQVTLGSTNGLASGGFHFVGGHVAVLGTGAGPAEGLISNWVLWEGGELDSSHTSLTIGAGHDSTVAIPWYATKVVGQLASMFVGHSQGFVGTFEQDASDSVVLVTEQMILGDCVGGWVGNVILSGGTLCVTNETNTANLDVRNGMFTLGAGTTLVVNNLTMTDACGRFVKQAGSTLVANALNLAPDLDADGDGQSNAEELAASTDPLDPASFFHITEVSESGGMIWISWTTVGGHNYVVQSSSVPTGTYVDSSPVIPAPGIGESVAKYGFNNTPGKHFFRVRLAP